MKMIGEYLKLMISLIASLFFVTASKTDYNTYTKQEYMNFLTNNRAAFEELVDAASADGKNGRFDIQKLARDNKIDIDNFGTKLQNTMEIKFVGNNNAWVEFEYVTSPADFSESGLFYSETGEMVLMDSSVFDYKYNDEKGCYVRYTDSVYEEIIPIDENWFFYQIAFYDDSGYESKPKAEDKSE